MGDERDSFHVVFGDLNDRSAFGGSWESLKGKVQLDELGCEDLEGFKNKVNLLVNGAAHDRTKTI